MGNRPSQTEVISFYQEALRTATTWPNFLAKLVLRAASYDGPHHIDQKQMWTRHYDSNIHYAYIFMFMSRDYHLIHSWHRVEGVPNTVEHYMEIEILSRHHKDGLWELHAVSAKDLVDYHLGYSEAEYHKLRAIIERAYILPKRITVRAYNDQEMIHAYHHLRYRSPNLEVFLMNLVDLMTVDVNGVRQPKYLGMNYHQDYLRFLELIRTRDIRQEFIRWHQENLSYPQSTITALILIVSGIPK